MRNAASRRAVVTLIHLLVSGLLSGCYSTSLLQDARVLPPKKARIAVGPAYALPREGQHALVVEGQLRVGIAEGVELQAKHTYLQGLGGAAKVALTQRDNWRATLLTGAQWAIVAQYLPNEAYWQDRDVVGANLTPLFGLDLARWLELLLAPDVQLGVRERDGWAPWFGMGARAGLAAHAGGHLTFVPECSALYIASGPAALPPGEDDLVADTVFTRGDVRAQCGVSLSFGSRYQ